MSEKTEHTYKLIEVTGSSGKSIDDAIHNAVNRSAETLDNLRWFEVTDLRGSIHENRVEHFQVTVKIGFTLNPATR